MSDSRIACDEEAIRVADPPEVHGRERGVAGCSKSLIRNDGTIEQATFEATALVQPPMLLERAVGSKLRGPEQSGVYSFGPRSLEQ